MKALIISINLISCFVVFAENVPSSIVYESKDKKIQIVLIAADDVNQDVNQPNQAYVIMHKKEPILCIQKAEADLLFLNMPKYSAIAYAVGLDLKYFDYSTKNFKVHKFDTSIFEDSLKKWLPDARKGALMHEWFSSMRTTSNDSFVFNYVFAKHPVTIQIETEVTLSLIDGELHAESRVINEIPLKWGEITPPDHTK